MITSKDNLAIKQLKRWLNKPKRDDETIVLEGIHLLQAYCASGGFAQQIWVAQSALSNLEIQSLIDGKPHHIISDALFRSISTLAQGQSILCTMLKPTAQPAGNANNAILLDGVQDAGNLGSILRSAAAAGVTDVYVNETCVNPFSPKVLRAAVGAHFSLNIIDGVDLKVVIETLKAHQVSVLATSLNSQTSIYQTDLTAPCAWLMGSEGAGVADDLIAAANTQVVIPMAAGESLNVAAATAVCVFEMARQQLNRQKS